MKKKILVPIDFARTSFAAYAYSCHLSKLLDYEVHILHVINGTFTSHQAFEFSPILDSRDTAVNQLTYFAEEYAKELDVDLPKVDLNYEIRFGIPGFTIADYAKDHNFDLIVMGTRDRHSMLNRMLGSVSATVISVSKCPVLLIHEHTQFHTPKKIVFAVDTRTDIEDAVDAFDILNRQLGAEVEFLHVISKDSEDEEVAARLEKKLVQELLDNGSAAYPMKFKILRKKSPSKALKQYSVLQNANILAMMHRKKGMFYRLFNPSKSVRVGQELQLPVLVFSE